GVISIPPPPSLTPLLGTGGSLAIPMGTFRTVDPGYCSGIPTTVRIVLQKQIGDRHAEGRHDRFNGATGEALKKNPAVGASAERQALLALALVRWTARGVAPR